MKATTAIAVTPNTIKVYNHINGIAKNDVLRRGTGRHISIASVPNHCVKIKRDEKLPWTDKVQARKLAQWFEDHPRNVYAIVCDIRSITRWLEDHPKSAVAKQVK